MTIAVSPTKLQVMTALQKVLIAMLPSSVEVVQGQINRTPEPKVPDFVAMTPIRRERIETNIDDAADAQFTGAIALTTLTVTSVSFGVLNAGSQLYGVGVLDGTEIVRQLSGAPGGVGAYEINESQTLADEQMAAGQTQVMQPTKFVVQLDFHGPNGGDNAQIVSTLFRDDYGVRAFAAIGPNVVPLYADDPKQIPFQNAEQQYEDRWVVEAALQANETVTVPQQYAGALAVKIVSVDAVYPP